MITSVGHLVSFVLLGLVLQVSSLNLDDPCTNPIGQAGRCINFRECQPIVSIWNKPVVSPEESSFVQQSQCGRGSTGALVCCVGVAPAPTTKATLPKPPHCGRDLSERIVGGQATALDEYPWLALIQYSKPRGNTGFHCGGSLINSRYVLTAAHCIQAIPRGWSAIGIRLGEWDLSKPNDCVPDDGEPNGLHCSDAPVDVGIDKIIVHENYQASVKAQYDDIALIRLNRDVSFSSYISPICLPLTSASEFKPGSRGWAAGFGRTENGTASNLKLKVELEFKDLKSCLPVYRTSGIVLRDTQLCAGGVRDKDTCSGDSGGPLTRIVSANHFLNGLVSFGPNKCGTKGVPGVYTNVAKYISWIENNLE